MAFYPVGTVGTPWGAAERAVWVASQKKQRDYFTDVVSPLLRFKGGDVFQYGTLDYREFGAAQFPLYAVKSSNWCKSRKVLLVTGGVHGYESSGIHGALKFIQDHLAAFSEKINVLVLPCISPWGYEVINRWTPKAIDPNRQFDPKEPGCDEAAAAMKCVLALAEESAGVLMHTDLHETTDSDNSEFFPAKKARDGEKDLGKIMTIPDGFYLIALEDRPQLQWHEAMRDAVAKVTHLAPADPADNTIAGETVAKDSIAIGPAIGDCSSFTTALFATTTEVYPDSERTNPEECDRAQVAAVVAGAEFALAHPEGGEF